MFSLLHPQSFAALYIEHRARVWGVVCGATTAVALFGFAALGPAYIESGQGITFAIPLFGSSDPSFDELEAELGPDAAPAQDTGPDSVAAQESARQLLSIARDASSSIDSIALVDDVRTQAMTHAELRISRAAFSGGYIVVMGVGTSRAALLELQGQYKRDTRFTKVELPFASLTGKDGAYPFTITLTPTAAAQDKKADPKKAS